ncbi:TonB-dependent receptor [Flavobacteriaceae bacterium R38]|nr:TonB-dependent receptor [Flavobacteriaceae bacterium R38]
MWSSSVKAQETSCTYSIKGKILDIATKQPIPYVTVKVKDIEKYALTDEKGDFVIEDLCSNTNILIISYLGYASITKEHKPGVDSHFYLTQEVTDLDGVTVRGEKSKEEGTETISQVRLSKEDIRSIPTQSLGAAVAEVDGVTFASVGSNVQLPVIHGLTGNRILFLNNGIKHAFQNWGNQHAPEIDINAANNVTVVKGAAGVRFGPEALSGVVLVDANPLLLDNPFYANVGTSFQTNGRGGNANFEIGNGAKKWSYFLNGSYTRLGDRSAPDFNLTNTGKEERAYGFGVLHHLDEWDFKIYYNFVEQDLGQLRGAFAVTADAFIEAINADVPRFTFPFSYDINEPNQVLQHQLAKAEVDWNYSDQGKLTFRFGTQLNKREEFDVRRNAELPIIDLELTTFDYQLEWKHPKWKGLDGLIGVQYFIQENENDAPRTLTTPFIPNYVAKRFSIFATEKVKFGQNTLEAGVRFDIEENNIAGREVNQDIFRDRYTFTNFTASLGYQWRLSDNSTFRTNLGSAFRTPNVAELFSFGQQGFSSTFGLLRFTNNNGVLSTSEVTLLDDSDVDLERGYKFTNEFRTSNENNAHAVTVYGHYIENFVFDRPLGVFGGVRGPQFAFFVDQADALFLGFDYTWKKELTKKISATYGFSYLWSRNVGENEPLINQPPISTNLEVQWDQGKLWFFESSKWSIRPSYTFRQFQAPRTVRPESLVDGSEIITENSEIFDFIDAPDGYFLLDASWNFKWKNLSGGITAQNLLNTSYRNYLNEFRYFSDEPGINLLFSLNYNFK